MCGSGTSPCGSFCLELGWLRDGWECCFVPIVAGTKSMKEEAWNEARGKIRIAKIRWSGGRARLMRVLLEEHEKVLCSFWAQVLGVERIEPEHVYCEGGMVTGESKRRGRKGRIERPRMQEVEEEKGWETRRLELEHECRGLELASGKSKSRG